MIHDVVFIEFYDNDVIDGPYPESTLVGLEQAVPWESHHIPLLNQEQFEGALNAAIQRHEAELKYLNGLKLILPHVGFTILREDATERGSLTAIVSEFWASYEED